MGSLCNLAGKTSYDVPGLYGNDGNEHPPGEIVFNPIMGIVVPETNLPQDHG